VVLGRSLAHRPQSANALQGARQRQQSRLRHDPESGARARVSAGSRAASSLARIGLRSALFADVRRGLRNRGQRLIARKGVVGSRYGGRREMTGSRRTGVNDAGADKRGLAKVSEAATDHITIDRLVLGGRNLAKHFAGADGDRHRHRPSRATRKCVPVCRCLAFRELCFDAATPNLDTAAVESMGGACGRRCQATQWARSSGAHNSGCRSTCLLSLRIAVDVVAHHIPVAEFDLLGRSSSRLISGRRRDQGASGSPGRRRRSSRSPGRGSGERRSAGGRRRGG